MENRTSYLVILIPIYRETVAKHLNRLAGNSHGCLEEVEKELDYVGKLLCDTALCTLPLLQCPKRQRWKNSTLTNLCSKSKLACKAWREAGSPVEGPLYDEECRVHRAVRKRIRFCAGQAENQRAQRETIRLPPSIRIIFGFYIGIGRFTQISSSMESTVANGEIIEDIQSLLDAWSQHSRI